ncbi:MAG TPA: helix-turn-helix transcriptional regulator [Gemmataceae bacterium]|nr:helix-turn-helix transcriptional regulator [Gemmataceae bacterium]
MQANLAEALREAIRASGKSAGQLAASSGVDKGIITRFLRGERSITVETADKLIAALGCAVTIKRVKGGASTIPDRPKRVRRGTTSKKATDNATEG